MSAYDVGNDHTAYLIAAALHQPAPRYPGDSRAMRYFYHVNETSSQRIEVDAKMGQALVDENFRSLDYRYEDGGFGEPYPFHTRPFVHCDFTPGKIFKAISCYEYQACEHPAWNTSVARSFCLALRDHYCSMVDGYEDAPWGAPEPIEAAAASRRGRS